MKSLIKILFIISFFYAGSLFSQETTEATLENQFIDVIEKSNRYQEYKVVKKFKLDKLRKNVTDTISKLKSTIDASNTKIDEQQNEINQLSTKFNNSQNELKASTERENNMVLFGISTSKSVYNIILWSIIGGLTFLMIIFFIRFKRSNVVTKETRLKFEEIETEFDDHRQRTLEREQQMRRKLQDEINKNKKSQ